MSDNGGDISEVIRRLRRRVEDWKNGEKSGTPTRRDLADIEAALEQVQNSGSMSGGARGDQFVSNLSHELRTPLTPALLIISALQMNTALPPQVRADLAIIRDQIELEVKLIDDLLDANQLARGRLQLRIETVDLRLLLEQLIEATGGQFSTGPVISFEWLAGRHLVRGDPARLVQIFSKLLQNAGKFTPTTGRVNVSAREVGESIEISIADTGHGFRPEILPEMFKGLAREGSSIKESIGGLGVGLAIARGLVSLHQGEIRGFSDGPGKGATFTVMLPSLAKTTPEPVNAPAGDSGSRRLQRVLRVLLVEDHQQSLLATARLLKTMGHVVCTAGGMITAEAALRGEPFDLLLADIELPDGDGWQLMQTALKKGPIVGLALSGHADDDHIRKSREAGFLDHLIKPITFQKLNDAIGQVVTKLAGH
jgi:signal transduction histidine kinase